MVAKLGDTLVVGTLLMVIDIVFAAVHEVTASVTVHVYSIFTEVFETTEVPVVALKLVLGVHE